MTRRAPAFVLQPQVPIARAMRRAALAQLDHALAALARREPGAAHETRKVCKRLRALLRLVRPQLAPSTYRADKGRLRDAAHLLALERETEVLARTARSVGLRTGRRVVRDEDARRQAARLLETTRRRVPRWIPRGVTAAQLAAGLQHGYRRARRAMRAAQRHPEAPALHEWRKRAKHHAYQCELASGIQPGLEPRRRRLDELTGALGDHHDLEMLRVELGRPSARLHEKQRRKAGRAFRLGEALFASRRLARSPA